MFDVLVLGGGVSGVSCALVLGSAKSKSFVLDKKIGIITHQKTSSLQEALFNNAYGIPKGKLGSDLLAESLQQLQNLYPHVVQIGEEKVLKLEGRFPNFTVITNKNSYQTKNIVVAIGYSNTFAIGGLMDYVEPHKKAIAEKPYAERIFLTGDVEHRITLHLINKADILLRTTKFDGDAISVREALFLETPVIATDNRMRPAGVDLIPIEDERALVKKILEIAGTERPLKTEKPDDKSNVKAIVGVYNEILKKKDSRKD